MSNNSYSLLKVCEDVVQNMKEMLPIEQTVHDNNQAKDLCDQVLASFDKIDQLQEGLINMVNYLQYDQPEEQKMIDLENQIHAHQQDINNNGQKLLNIQNEFINSPWLNMDYINLLVGRGGHIKMEYLDKDNILLDYKAKQMEKKHLLRKKLLSMKKPPKVEKIKIKDDRCIVKTEIYQINYDLIYDSETDWFYWKIPRTKDIQISDNGLSYLQNFLKDDKSKKDIQHLLDELTKSLQKQRKKLNSLTKERSRRFAFQKAKQEEQVKLQGQELKEEQHISIKQEGDISFSVKNDKSMELEMEGNDEQDEFNYQILKYKEQLKDQYVFCFVDQKIKTIFSDQVLEILQKSKNKENMQKKFGPEVIFLQKNSETKDSLRFNNVLIKYQPQTAMLQSVLKQENQLKYRGENKIQQTSIYIEHISYDISTYYQFILSQEKINFYKFLRSKTQAEQREIIEKIQVFQPHYRDKEQINFKDIIIQEAIKNDLLPKQIFSLTPFDTIYIKTNITLSQIDSTLLTPFLNLEEENQNSVDSLFLINKPKEAGQSQERVVNPSNSDNGSYLQVVIGDKIDVEIILQQYRVIMLQQFFISNYKLSQQEEILMHLESNDDFKSNNITLLIRQKREIYEEDRNLIKINKAQNWHLSQAVVRLSNHSKIKNIVYQVLICIKVTCSDMIEHKDDPEIYYIIIPYLTDKQHYLIYSNYNQDMIELDSQKEQELDELIQDLQKKESVIQNFVNTVFIAQAVQQNIFHSQFKAIKQDSFNNYKQITIECRLKDELNSDKPIRINVYNNFEIKFQYTFGDLQDEKSMERCIQNNKEQFTTFKQFVAQIKKCKMFIQIFLVNKLGIQRNCTFFEFYQKFFINLNANIQQCLKHIYQRYFYLSDDRTKFIKEALKNKISNDGWYTPHTLKTRPETILPIINQINGSNQNQQYQSANNGQQNGIQNSQLAQQQQIRQNQNINQQQLQQNAQVGQQQLPPSTNNHHHHPANQIQGNQPNSNGPLNPQGQQGTPQQGLNNLPVGNSSNQPNINQVHQNPQIQQQGQGVNYNQQDSGNFMNQGGQMNQRSSNQNQYAVNNNAQQQQQGQQQQSQVQHSHNQGVPNTNSNVPIVNHLSHINGQQNPNYNSSTSSSSQHQVYPQQQNQQRSQFPNQ